MTGLGEFRPTNSPVACSGIASLPFVKRALIGSDAALKAALPKFIYNRTFFRSARYLFFEPALKDKNKSSYTELQSVAMTDVEMANSSGAAAESKPERL